MTSTKLTYHLKAKPKEYQFSISSPIGGTQFPPAFESAVIANWTQENTSQNYTLNSIINKC